MNDFMMVRKCGLYPRPEGLSFCSSSACEGTRRSWNGIPIRRLRQSLRNVAVQPTVSSFSLVPRPRALDRSSKVLVSGPGALNQWSSVLAPAPVPPSPKPSSSMLSLSFVETVCHNRLHTAQPHRLGFRRLYEVSGGPWIRFHARSTLPPTHPERSQFSSGKCRVSFH